MMLGNLQVNLYVNNINVPPLSVVFNKSIALHYKVKTKNNNLRSLLMNITPLKIEWWVNNTGIEAKNANQLNFSMNEYFNKQHCNQSTIYNGIHYMVFKEIEKNLIIKYPLIINDDKIEVKTLWKNN